uniref:Uncharacterized protein n=1 Tax=Tetraodon nigroviridis TaxID=99883 RepID=H3DNR7_TETNG
MSRLLSLSLLLIILAELYSSAALRPNFKVSKAHIRKCRCQVLAGGKMRCPLSRGKPITQQELHNCFCGKANRHKFPEFQEQCKLLNMVISTPV